MNQTAPHVSCGRAAATSLASAQTTYRWVDQASGQTVYSDQPPPPGTPWRRQGRQRSPRSRTAGSVCHAAGGREVSGHAVHRGQLHRRLHQARDLLNQRGVPFTEKMLNTEEDQAEFAKQMGSKDAMVPSLTVGQQKFRGLESGAWNNLLDLAGYPKSAPFGAKPSGAFAE
jgi:hypothetical protein